jgi:hypothetical protein
VKGEPTSCLILRSPSGEQPAFTRAQARQIQLDDPLQKAGGAELAGGVSDSGGFGLGGARATLGAGRTSIGGGNGVTCWLTTGAPAVELFAAGALGAGGTAGGRGTASLGLDPGRR